MYGCNVNARGQLNIPRNVPPSHQAVGLWQDDNVLLMPEKEAFEGAFACGTDKTRGGKGSYWVVGASINCGNADEYTCFLKVTLYKLHWALELVEDAIALGVVPNGDGTKMRNEVLTAIGDLNKGNITEARKHVLNFDKFARAAPYDTSKSEISFSAQFEARAGNLLWTLSKLTAAKQFVAQ